MRILGALYGPCVGGFGKQNWSMAQTRLSSGFLCFATERRIKSWNNSKEKVSAKYCEGGRDFVNVVVVLCSYFHDGAFSGLNGSQTHEIEILFLKATHGFFFEYTILINRHSVCCWSNPTRLPVTLSKHAFSKNSCSNHLWAHTIF